MTYKNNGEQVRYIVELNELLETRKQEDLKNDTSSSNRFFVMGRVNRFSYRFNSNKFMVYINLFY